MEIAFPGGARVDAEYNGFVIKTDQPWQGGGEGSAPTPLAFFSLLSAPAPAFACSDVASSVVSPPMRFASARAWS